MKIVQINSVNYGSTGNIMLDISAELTKRGMENYVAYPDGVTARKKTVSNSIIIGTRFGKNLHSVLGMVTGYYECFSIIDTLRFISKLKKIKPDLVHFHNLHPHYINIHLLFRYLKNNNIPAVWTLHDCWAFTGKCPHFDYIGCDKWKSGCSDCPQLNDYPFMKKDRTDYLWKKKKRLFTALDNLNIVTPSQWLHDLVKQSYLKRCGAEVIHNGIDLSVFKPCDSHIIKEQHALLGEKIILGVSLGWNRKKGIEEFEKLSALLPEDYKIVLIGADEETKANISKKILAISRTSGRDELAEWYSSAHVFVNPTLEDNYPTVNMEAIACGTPVVTYNTGGSPEALDTNCGAVVEKNDVAALTCAIEHIEDLSSKEACLKRAEQFSKEKAISKYIELYEKITGNKQ